VRNIHLDSNDFAEGLVAKARVPPAVVLELSQFPKTNAPSYTRVTNEEHSIL
jgi:hypothetical protein